MSNFNFVASFYDRLSRLVFQKSIEQASQQMVDWVKPGSKVLILGGGTGKLLEQFKNNASIDYVELSTKMIEQAKNRACVGEVSFYNHDYLLFESTKKYDYIICPFFLDLFVPVELNKVINKIKEELTQNGKLLVLDFSPKNTGWFNLFLLQVMILFFRVFSGIKIKTYNNLFDEVEKEGFVSVDSFSKRNNFVLCKTYKYTII